MIRASSLLLTSGSCLHLQKSIVHRHVMRAAASKKLEVPGIEEITKKKPVVLTTVTQNSPSPLVNQDTLLKVASEEITKNANSPQSMTPAKLTNHYSSLAKFRLTGLVVCSAVTGYAMAPLPTNFTTLGLCLLGTALTSASANTINQFFEVPFDSQMARTSNRVLVRGLLSPLHAVSFAAVSGTTGLIILNYGVNGVCASLGALTLALYTLVYTPMKRSSIANTWVGSIVGALPPLMGYAGCTGYLDAGAMVLGGVLYAWQFPHFNALSWNLRSDYSRAGYRMMAVTNPDLCRRTTLRHTAALIGICSTAPLIGLTTWTFALDSLPVNLYFLILAWRFYRHSDSSSSRKLFRMSLAHLPIIMILMLVHKKKEDSEDWLLKTIRGLFPAPYHS
ncbi:protoheme IX farnesyltransferase, mitochondrial [Daphnia magna]|uniref:Protoheme IX farnesyltransferase, mitochondrial n=1 Tax=Daphnia magna TaxID=35525 RepID=A0A0P5DVP4_9CRUS|nr:protoheme IX farnesyltransferase, mitochondrial [Daphnia magna]XP_045024579.1 protoheme IX farnesyltransferase, mitochondrial [Daphnia magna]KZS21542.1 Protoheme IX farnesyltransferase [Daphnia magna]